MMRLLRSGLMYGGLVEVATPTMVGRYNRALEKLTGRRTALDSFHIDLSGFAPEIGEETHRLAIAHNDNIAVGGRQRVPVGQALAQ